MNRLHVAINWQFTRNRARLKFGNESHIAWSQTYVN